MNANPIDCFDMAENVPAGTEVSARVTTNRGEAEEYNPIQGSGPWWVCCVTPVVRCGTCQNVRVVGYFKASSGSLQLALALAVRKWKDFEKLT
jgi:hypothetical protein